MTFKYNTSPWSCAYLIDASSTHRNNRCQHNRILHHATETPCWACVCLVTDYVYRYVQQTPQTEALAAYISYVPRLHFLHAQNQTRNAQKCSHDPASFVVLSLSLLVSKGMLNGLKSHRTSPCHDGSTAARKISIICRQRLLLS